MDYMMHKLGIIGEVESGITDQHKWYAILNRWLLQIQSRCNGNFQVHLEVHNDIQWTC